MRKINLIVLHCSATKDTQTYTPEQLERDHKARGFIQAGYHFYIRRNGEIVWQCRNCGYIVKAKMAPKICPSCEHEQRFFEPMADNY